MLLDVARAKVPLVSSRRTFLTVVRAVLHIGAAARRRRIEPLERGLQDLFDEQGRLLGVQVEHGISRHIRLGNPREERRLHLHVGNLIRRSVVRDGQRKRRIRGEHGVRAVHVDRAQNRMRGSARLR